MTKKEEKKNKKRFEKLATQVLEGKGKMETLAMIVANDENAFILFGNENAQELIIMEDGFLNLFKEQVTGLDSPEAHFLLACIMEIQAKRKKAEVSRFYKERSKSA